VSEFLQRVEVEIQNRQLVSRSQKILVAVSGGADSLVLLHVLVSLAEKNRWQISVAHFNHQLRGLASDADERLVKRTAEKLRLKFFNSGADVKRFATRSKISVEMAARKLRHEFLARVAREHKISTIALAHHADDQAELFFLRLLRGAGGEGLAGMKWVSRSPVDKKLLLIRPFLGFTKIDLLAYAQAQAVSFREDASNASADFLRNRVRHELLPLLAEKYQPGIYQTVTRLMEIVGTEAEFVSAAAHQWLAKPSPAFEHLAWAVQRQVVNQQLHAHGVTADFELVEQLRRQMGKFISVGKDLFVACVAGKLNWRTTAAEIFNPAALTVSLAKRTVQFGGRKFSWSRELVRSGQGGGPVKARMSALELLESFDADEVGLNIILRHWRSGDRFQPIGMPKAVKLQDLFVNAKIPAARRHELILATTAAGEIFWVEGLRIGEQFKLTRETKAKLEWKCSVLPV